VRRLSSAANLLSAIVLLSLGACASGERPDDSGLTSSEKSQLVERYYACARQGDAVCVRDMLHPEFQASENPGAPVAGAAHAQDMIGMLQRARVEARVLPHQGEEVWVTELWIDRHGSTASRLRTFSFADRLIRAKTVLGT
jgi:hypothetical protein